MSSAEDAVVKSILCIVTVIDVLSVSSRIEFRVLPVSDDFMW